MVAVMGSASAAGVVVWLFLRTRRLDGHHEAALNGQVVDLQNEIEAIRGEMTRLKEQADFTERLLSAGSAQDDRS
jgi:hypothetical protein